jgi:osmotically-inducible protein OsmY
MKIAGQLTLAAVLPILLFVSSCQMLRSEGTVQVPTTETPQDEALSKAVLDRLAKDKKVDLTGVKVVSSGGTVYLNGTVTSLDAREQTIKIAWETPGVKSVVNSLVVQE